MKVNKVRKFKLFRIEKLLYIIVVCIVLFSPVAIVFSKATLSKLNIEVERLKKQVDNQESRNQSLSMKVNELSSLENIQMIAENMGLRYNNDNIRIISH